MTGPPTNPGTAEPQMRPGGRVRSSSTPLGLRALPRPALVTRWESYPHGVGLIERPIDPRGVRELFRTGLATPTSGWAPGFVQANLIALPEVFAEDFRTFARNNPKPCPILDSTAPGSVTTVLAPSADLRTALADSRV